MRNAKRIPECMLDAAKIKLPPQPSFGNYNTMFTAEDWNAPFEWYNKHFQKKLRRSCAPCYIKVYEALRKEKASYELLSGTAN